MSPPRKKVKKEEVKSTLLRTLLTRNVPDISDPDNSHSFADDSDSGVIRFEIDKISTVNKENGRFSPEVEIGGAKWSTIVSTKEKYGEDHLFVALHCLSNQSPLWSIKANYKIILINSDSQKNLVKRMLPVILNINHDQRGAFLLSRKDLLDEKKGFVNDDKITVECHFTILSTRGIKTLEKSEEKEEVMSLPLHAHIEFRVHSHLTNQVFIIEGRRIYAGKDFLSLHSPFFHALFNSDFAEKNQDELELKDVSYEDFHEMLKVLHKTDRLIDYYFIEALLVLGDRYGIKAIVDRVEESLIESDRYTKEDKLILAERYRLIKLDTNCKMSDGLNEEVKDSQIVMKLYENSIDDIRNLNWIASGPVPSLFDYDNCILSVHSNGIQPKPFDIGGLLWALDGSFKKVEDDNIHLSFCLVVNDNRASEINWSAEGVVEIELAIPGVGGRDDNEDSFMDSDDSDNEDMRKDDQIPIKKQYEFSLDNNTRFGWTGEFVVKEAGHYFVMARVYLRKLTGVREIPQFDFTVPSPMSDATLVLENKRLYVNKQYLSIVSKYFRVKFSDYPSKSHDEFMINVMDYQKFDKYPWRRSGGPVLREIEYQDCLELLNWIYPSFTKNFEDMDRFIRLSLRFIDTFIADDIKKYLRKTPSYAHFAEKIVFYFSYPFADIELHDIVCDVRRMLKDDEDFNEPSCLLPLIEKSKCYEDMKSDSKVHLLQWMARLPRFVHD